MTPFDCIEFQPALRWIDVMSEIAFLVMDLDVHGRPDLAWRLLNAYLEVTGDYAGLPVLPLYLVYRAVVRAKVDALRLRQTGISDGDQRLLTADQYRHLDLATGYTQPRSASLTITHGISGSGKTTGSQSLVEHQQAIRVRSDVERKRLFGLDPAQSAADDVTAGIYSLEATEQTYNRLARLAQDIIGAGFPVIVDATFLRGPQRRRFRELAGKRHVPFAIIPFALDDQTLRERISRRSATDNDASDATLQVLGHQLQTREPLTPDELTFVLSPDSWAGMTTSESVRQKLPGT